MIEMSLRLGDDIPIIGEEAVYVPEMIIPYHAFMIWIQSLNDGDVKKIAGFIPVFSDFAASKRFGVRVTKRYIKGASELNSKNVKKSLDAKNLDNTKFTLKNLDKKDMK